MKDSTSNDDKVVKQVTVFSVPEHTRDTRRGCPYSLLFELDVDDPDLPEEARWRSVRIDQEALTQLGLDILRKLLRIP